MEEKVLIIDRSKWRTGDFNEGFTGLEDTALLNNKGFMCCLGFACIMEGVDKEVLLGIGDPSDLSPSEKQCLPEYLREYTEFVSTAISINDTDAFTSDQRELEIIKHFATEGITVQFINEYE